MAATITDNLKKIILEGLYSSYTGKLVDGSIPAVAPDNYYIGIGKSEQWDELGSPPPPTPSTDDIIKFQSSLQSVKKVQDVSYVVPRINWSAGSIYTPWDNKNSSDTTFGSLNDIIGSYYVITDQSNVYICIEQGMTATGVVRNSTSKPSGTTSDVFATGDGYLWKFMYNVGVFNSRRYLTSNYMPVERVPNADEVDGKQPNQLSASRLEQKNLQDLAVPGQVIGIAVDSGGVGYPVNAEFEVTVEGVHAGGLDARAYARTNPQGKIFQCVMKEDAESQYSFGSKYGKETWAYPVTGTVGSGSKLRPIVCLDSGGLGADPRNDLNTSALMYTARLVGNEYETFNVQNDFRQIGLIENPTKDSASPAPLTSLRADAMKRLYITPGAEFDKTTIGGESIVYEDGDPSIRAIVDYYEEDSSNGIIHCHQNIDTGWKPFTATPSTIKIGANEGTTIPIALQPMLRYAGMDNLSGKVLYIDNRVAIERDADQTEDIKIIIDL